MKTYRNHFANNCLVAEHRNQRPYIGESSTSCPFCLQQECALESIIDEIWEEGRLLVRIVPNKYPIAKQEGLVVGYHDVVIDTDEHLKKPKDFSLHHWKVLLGAMQKRWYKLSEDENIHFIQLFKNSGVLAGASIHHSHWQIVALRDVPMGMCRQYEHYSQEDNKCFLCDDTHLIEAKLIKETNFWQIIVPPEPTFLYEIWLIPRAHHQHFGQLSEDEIEELGCWMKKLLQIYEKLIPECSYNICFMSGDLKQKWQYHFYIKLMMRKNYIAGFEIATLCAINDKTIDQYAFEIKTLLEE